MIFKNKAKEEIVTKVVPCNTEGNLKECDSVAKIRECQEKLINIKQTDIRRIIKEYLNIDDISYLDRSHEIERFLNVLNKEVINYTKYKSFTEYFTEFGSKLDDYFNKQKIISELDDVIKEEKRKLGIY